MSTDRFSDKVCRELGNYVYRLVDPRNGETFYVGKGTGNRVFQHARDALSKKAKGEDDINLKLGRIRRIIKAKLEVQNIIHRHNIPDEAIFDVEAAVIDAFPGLTNIMGGRGSGLYGPRHVREIAALYDMPALEPDPAHRLILINVNRYFDDDGQMDLYDQVRFAWRISAEKAKVADYVLAVVRGVAMGAYVATNWLPATRANFPNLATQGEITGRMGFIGHPAPAEIWDRYVGAHGRKVTHPEMRHSQNPIRYWSATDSEDTDP